MGITAVLETEQGQKIDSVEDPTNTLHRLLPSGDDAASFHCVGYIDRHGDTVFNRLQSGKFLAEWHSLVGQDADPETRRVFDGIQRLAERVRDDVHLYLKFYGD